LKKHLLTSLSCLASKKPKHSLVNGLDFVAIYDEIDISVLYGRCLHRGALLGDGHIQGENLICGLHGWDYRYDTGVSEYSNLASLHKFNAWIEDTNVYIDMSEVENFLIQNPQPFDRQAYQVDYADTHPETTEP
jgi:nitrite reductase/ring-hydroxylating ferredoxin subunit